MQTYIVLRVGIVARVISETVCDDHTMNNMVIEGCAMQNDVKADFLRANGDGLVVERLSCGSILAWRF
jgi:hypothetical protein